ncbi:MAG: hypothetical protein RTV72_14785 [Candidatus Thorarchaeota archaeon]
MQYFTSDIEILIIIMALSWLVSFVSQFAIMRWAIQQQKPMVESDEKERITVSSAYGLGAIPGVLAFLVLGSIVPVTNGPVIFSASFTLVSIWILLLIVIGTLGGHIAIRINKTS